MHPHLSEAVRARKLLPEVRAVIDALRHIYLTALDEVYPTYSSVDVFNVCEPAAMSLLEELRRQVRQRTLKEVRVAWSQRQ